MMDRIAVQSSSLEAVAYDPAEQILEVVFHANKAGVKAVWRYSPVSQETFDSMLAEGASAGRIFQTVKASPSIVAFKVGEEEAVPA